MSIFKSQYYDKPDGEDYAGKMCATNRLALQGATGAAILDVLMYSHPKGILPIVSRFLWWMGPAVGMASAFTTGTYAANKLRGKDDTYNYLVGACASAGVFGAWRRSAVAGFTMCIFFSIAAATKRVSIDEGWEFFPNTMYKHGVVGVSATQHDYTLTSVGEKGWTTGKE